MLKHKTGVVRRVSNLKPDILAIRECLAYLAVETERADYDYCSLHLRLAIEELDCASVGTGSCTSNSRAERKVG